MQPFQGWLRRFGRFPRVGPPPFPPRSNPGLYEAILSGLGAREAHPGYGGVGV